MLSWLLWAFAGVLPWVAFFALLWLARGITLRRLAWPDLPRMTSRREASEILLAPRMSANKVFYGPLFVAGLVLGALVTVEAGAIGLAVVTLLSTPAVLSLIATARVYLHVRALGDAERDPQL